MGISSVDSKYTLLVCCVVYWTRKQACLLTEVRISEYHSAATISRVFMKPFTRPIKCCISYNKVLHEVLLCLGEKITGRSTCFGLVLSKLYRATQQNNYIWLVSNCCNWCYQQIKNDAECLVSSEKLQNCSEIPFLTLTTRIFWQHCSPLLGCMSNQSVTHRNEDGIFYCTNFICTFPIHVYRIISMVTYTVLHTVVGTLIGGGGTIF